jgi:hypothetical protein
MAARRPKRLIFISFIAGLAVSAFPGRAAAGTLDQSQTSFGSGELGFGSAREIAQSFTPGLNGTLDQVDVAVFFTTYSAGGCNPGSGITVAIRTLTDDTPTNITLASANFPASSVSSGYPGSWVSLSFAAPPAVTAGVQYALVLSAPDAFCSGFSSPYIVGLAGGDPYSRGHAMAKIPSGWVNANGSSDNDLPFKTYISPPGNSSPIPSSPSPPPSDATPSNAISLGKAVLNKTKGTATVPVFVPGPGIVRLRGKGVFKQRREKAFAGIVNMLVKPSGETQRKLNRTGKAKIKITVTYVSTGGTPSTKSMSLGLKKQLR